MASRLVVLRQRLAKAIHAALESFSEIVTPALTERISPFLEEGEALFDFSLMQQVMRRMAEASFERMVAADDAHIDELTDDIGPRQVRDRWVDSVRQKLVDIRPIVQGLFGSKRAIEIVAVDGRTARQPEHLWRQAEHTLGRLRDPDLQIPEASTASVVFDPGGLADELEPMVTALRSAIDGVEVDRRDSANTQQEKLDAMNEHDLMMAACGRILSGFYLLAGRGDLARRIRISLPRRRRSGTGEESAAAASAAQTSGDPSNGAQPSAESGGEQVA